MRYRWLAGAMLAVAAVALAACGGSTSAPPAHTGHTGHARGGPASTAPAGGRSASTAPAGGRSASTAPGGAGSTAPASAVGLKTAHTSAGTILETAAGQPVYWFAIDTPGKSNCTGECLKFWPPVQGTPSLASGTSLQGQLGTIMGTDGQTQATYLGHPLYTYVSDSGGTPTGNGLNLNGGLWWAMTPSGSTIRSGGHSGGAGHSGGGTSGGGKSGGGKSGGSGGGGSGGGGY